MASRALRQIAGAIHNVTPFRRGSVVRDEHAHEVKTRQELAAVLASASPTQSGLWFVAKHPVARVTTCAFVLWLNLYVYYGDPASFSNAESYGTLLGDIYHGWFEPDTPAFLAARLFVMVSLGVLGILGGLVLHRVFRDRFKLAFFGYDNGLRPDRDPLADQDGAVFLVIMSTALSWFAGLKIYRSFLAHAGQSEHRPNSGMHQWTYAGYNFALAGVFTYVSDVFNLVTVVDQMLQAVDLEAGLGYEVYGGGNNNPRLQALARWFTARRLVLTRFLLVVPWGLGCLLMTLEFRRITHVLFGEEGDTAVDLAPTLKFWTTRGNTEYTRMLAGAVVGMLNVCIVMQDWDFPNFADATDIKISALDFSAIKVPKFFYTLPAIYVSGKWFSYLGVMMGIAFDWGYWAMTALVFRPCDYAIFWDSDSERMYTLTRPKKLQEKHAGAASAKNCEWFTDNPMLDLYKTRWEALNLTLAEAPGDDTYWDDATVVRIDTGVFTGTYTLDEADETAFTKQAALMNLMCILPMAAICVFLWIVLTHEKVHCLNASDVLSVLEKNAIDKPTEGVMRAHAEFSHLANKSLDSACCCCCCCCPSFHSPPPSSSSKPTFADPPSINPNSDDSTRVSSPSVTNDGHSPSVDALEDALATFSSEA